MTPATDIARLAILLVLVASVACTNGANGGDDPDATVEADADATVVADALTDASMGDAKNAVDAGHDAVGFTDVTPDIKADGSSDAGNDALIPTDANVDAGAVDVVDALDADVAPDTTIAAPCGKPGICFSPDAPGPHAKIVAVPPPNIATCTHDAGKLLKVPLKGPPSLPITIGVGDPKTKIVTAYKPGQFIPITHGPQGLLHVDGGFTIAIAGAKAEKRKLRVAARVYFGCEEAAYANFPTLWVEPIAGKQGHFHNVGKIKPGIEVVFPIAGNKSCQICGKWADLRLFIYDPGTTKWGTKSVHVRLHDTFKFP